MSKNKNVVNDYRFVVSGDEYTAPELRRFHLQGEPSWLVQGNKMTTSPIVSVQGRTVTTRNGSIYVLGKRAKGHPSFEKLRAEYPGVPLS